MDTNSILLVDDEFCIVEALAEVLQREGYSVRTAPNGQRALEELKRAPAALILLDYMMPVMDGLQALAKIRADAGWQKIPVVFMTAAALPDTASGWDALLRKPFEATALLKVLRRLLPPPGSPNVTAAT